MTELFRILFLASLLSLAFPAHAAAGKGQGGQNAAAGSGTFDHEVMTDFPLKDRHKSIKCTACHKSERFDDSPPFECVSCHAKNETHRGRFSRQCGDCHTARSWKEIRFDHDKQTAFPLLDRHSKLQCSACHRDGPFRVRRACVSCHLKDDAHKGSQGQECGNCHNQKGWKDGQFDHDGKTSYPLNGKHKDLSCTDCHKDGQYQNPLPTGCVSCHQRNDRHKKELGSRCENCHSETGWKNSLFDHAQQAGVQLPGKHQGAPCLGCHQGGHFKAKVPNLCVYCHAKDDSHKRLFGALCANCHTEQGWHDITFVHTKERTHFDLAGRHQGVKCDSCHKGRLYMTRVPHDCYYCHQKDDKHRDPARRRCETCHTEQGWNRYADTK